jgi:hypothetical protein
MRLPGYCIPYSLLSVGRDHPQLRSVGSRGGRRRAPPRAHCLVVRPAARTARVPSLSRSKSGRPRHDTPSAVCLLWAFLGGSVCVGVKNPRRASLPLPSSCFGCFGTCTNLLPPRPCGALVAKAQPTAGNQGASQPSTAPQNAWSWRACNWLRAPRPSLAHQHPPCHCPVPLSRWSASSVTSPLLRNEPPGQSETVPWEGVTGEAHLDPYKRRMRRGPICT